MRNVKIYFNPYLERTRLIIDGEEKIGGQSRLEEFITNQPLDKWLAPYVFSYQKWDGLLPELMEDLNDDEVHIQFFTLPKYFPIMAEEFDKQTSLIEEKGYSSDFWRCICEEAFLPKNVRAAFLKFVASKKRHAPDQYSINLFDRIEYALNDRTPNTTEKLREIYDNLLEAVQHSKEACRHVRRKANEANIHLWENAEQELLNIFEF